MNYFLLTIGCVIMLVSCTNESTKKKVETYVQAPFTGLDTLATNDWWNRKQAWFVNMKVRRDSAVAFGIYTVHDSTLKLTAQLYPLYPEESRTVRLEFWQDADWQEVQRQEVNEIGWNTLFRIDNWDVSKDVKYRIRQGEDAYFEGMIRNNPMDKQEIVVASLSCNGKYGEQSRDNYVRNINYQDPDLVFFAGDQTYWHEEHTAAWLLFGEQFKEIFRNRPCITIVDDHDIGQPNLWGEGGRKSDKLNDDEAGYHLQPEFVKMAERTQMQHLPDPYDPTPIKQDIRAYYTNYAIGDVDFAILEDRKWKSGPKNVKIEREGRMDHITASEYDPEDWDNPALKLLGDRQISFLDDWSKDQEAAFKVVLSQTGFSAAVHLHGDTTNRLSADLDANGWPQSGRNRALRIMQKANAIHLAGDQHLATVFENHIDSYDESVWCFLSPAISNSIYGRWWWPKDEKKGENGNERLPWTGQYKDGFGNKLTMHAYANREQGHNAEGYGLVRFQKSSNTVIFECWPRGVDVTKTDAEQYNGWPVVVDMSR